MMMKTIINACSVAFLLVLLHLPYHSSTWSTREVSDTYVAREVADGLNTFAANLHRSLSAGSGQQGNLFFSPYSISVALAMTMLGARGNTAAEMHAALIEADVTDSDLHLSVRNLQNLLNSEENVDYLLESANRLFIQNDYSMLGEFTRDCELFYGAPADVVDFRENTEAARTLINQWVEGKTHDKIRELLKPGVVSPATRLVLVNAVYFKGEWKYQFKESLTRAATFHVSASETVDVQMMSRKGIFTVGDVQELGSRVLALPYKGDDLTMRVILPDEGVSVFDVESKLDIAALNRACENFHNRTVEVSMPKFELTKYCDLQEALGNLGIHDMFGESAADFSGITGSRDLYMSKVVHKAFVKVNEEGSEAAAATAVIMQERMMAYTEQITVNRPFLFVIQDTRSGSVLFMGRVMRPSETNGRDEL